MRDRWVTKGEHPYGDVIVCQCVRLCDAYQPRLEWYLLSCADNLLHTTAEKTPQLDWWDRVANVKHWINKPGWGIDHSGYCVAFPIYISHKRWSHQAVGWGQGGMYHIKLHNICDSEHGAQGKILNIENNDEMDIGIGNVTKLRHSFLYNWFSS